VGAGRRLLVCYLAVQGQTAFAEMLLRELDLVEVSERRDLAQGSLPRVRLERSLVLARLDGQGLRRMAPMAAVVQGPYPATWAWSPAIQDDRDHVDGTAYRTRHDDGLSAAQFDRAADTVTVG
jgi:hypothetical protein